MNSHLVALNTLVLIRPCPLLRYAAARGPVSRGGFDAEVGCLGRPVAASFAAPVPVWQHSLPAPGCSRYICACFEWIASAKLDLACTSAASKILPSSMLEHCLRKRAVRLLEHTSNAPLKLPHEPGGDMHQQAGWTVLQCQACWTTPLPSKPCVCLGCSWTSMCCSAKLDQPCRCA